ncbi:MAG: penicillin-binding transpeptidase domain-containing protein, partial [Sphingomicrobium sp.]
LLYNHEASDSRVLVAPWVAAEMTDLLQSAVLSGTGRAAQIGRPVAGKTGTTSSNKDGWFVGFSSGLTTGVWMGRDDAKPIPGLQGGTAPARAFHDFMVAATANRPVETFETQVPLPDWQLEPDEEAMGLPLDGNIAAADAPLVDADGNPILQPERPLPQPSGEPSGGQPAVRPDGTGAPDQSWLDDVLNRGQRQRPAPPPTQQVRQPPPSPAPADAAQDGTEPAQ